MLDILLFVWSLWNSVCIFLLQQISELATLQVLNNHMCLVATRCASFSHLAVSILSGRDFLINFILKNITNCLLNKLCRFSWIKSLSLLWVLYSHFGNHLALTWSTENIKEVSLLPWVSYCLLVERRHTWITNQKKKKRYIIIKYTAFNEKLSKLNDCGKE